MTEPKSAGIGMALIIDDEKVDQMIYRRVLEQSGVVHDSMAFSMAQDALDYLKRKDRPPVDVVFLDINMPRMNGLEFLEEAVREFGEDFARLVIVMLTTSINPVDHNRAMEFKAVRKFLYKPLTTDHVAEVADLVAGLNLNEARSASA